MLKLDDRDIQILATLQTDGRISKSELARRVNLSPSPCWERLKRLEDAGLIQGYYARIDLHSIAASATVLVEITLSSHTQDAFQAFEAYIQEVEEIRDCWATGGGVDYMMKMVVKSIDDYQRLIDRILSDEVGVARYFTYIVTKQVKDAPGVPVEKLLSIPQ